MNKNSKNIDKMLTVGYSKNKEVTAGMFKTPLMIVKVNKKQTIYIIDIMGSVVKWAYMTDNKMNHIGIVRTTKTFMFKNKRYVQIRGKKILV